MKKGQNHILVIRLSAIGDVAMVVPVLRALISQNPDLIITVVSKGFLKPLFRGLKQVNFYEADVKGKHKGLIGLYRLFREVRQLRPDAVADIHNVLRSKVLRFFFSINGVKATVIDKGRAEKKALARSRQKIFKQLKTTHERYADVFRGLGFTIELSNPVFPEKPDLSKLDLPELKNLTGKWLGIAPFAKHESKMYPLDLMEVVIAGLIKAKFCVFLFGGGSEETKALNKLASTYENTLSVGSKISFSEELVLIANLDAMLSMDSANGHLAAMQGVKTFTIWGSTHPYAGFSPFDQPASNSLCPDRELYPKLPCSIYGNKNCDGYQDVMRSISPDKIIELIKNNL